MEALKGYDSQVKFSVPNDLTEATFTVTRNSVQVVPPTPVTPESGVATVNLPYAAIYTEGDITVTLTFAYENVNYSEAKQVEVVTPYLAKWEILEIYPEASDSEAIKVEQAVRHVINAHTGQSFGKSTKTISVEAHGDRALRLPERLLSLTGVSSLTSVLDVRGFIVVSDGWYLKKSFPHSTAEIENDSQYWYGWGSDNPANYDPGIDDWRQPAPGEPGYEKPSHGPVIVAPNTLSAPTAWTNDYPYSISGVWGYESVPEPVREAAKLLVNDYACSEQLYRDRYLESIKAADWRLQFSSRAWEYTGNVRADQLLSEYVILDWGVI